MRVKYLVGGFSKQATKHIPLARAIKVYKHFKHTLHLKGVKLSLF